NNFYAHRCIRSLAQTSTRLELHTMDNSDPAKPKMVHAFMPRDTPGYTSKETWDKLGMRATRSDDTIIDGAFVPDHYCHVVGAGFAGADLFVLGIFAWAEPTFANIYYAIAQRASDIAIASLGKRTSVANNGKTNAHNPMNQ